MVHVDESGQPENPSPIPDVVPAYGDSQALVQVFQVVEVSDLAGLAHVLDDELTSFVGALLREPAGGDQKRG